MGDNVLVVAAHPDDEVLGCGATVARHTAAGDRVHVLILADGVCARDDDAQAVNSRAEAARAAAAILGAEPPQLLSLPDNRLDAMPLLDIVRQLEAVVEELRPRVLYTHHAGDLNVDHRIAHQAVMTACRPLPGASCRRILCFEVPSSTGWQAPGHGTDFVPNWYVDVSATLRVKLEALRPYRDELRPWPHARSLEAIEHLAGWRGATVGMYAAEAFVLARALN
jgi:N-acetylglucosamine malate deacetylase 1